MGVHFEIFSSVEDIDRRLWNQLAVTANPMMEWEYFYCLEKSASVSRQRGYQPSHIVAYDGRRPVALAPLYERDRAWVEFGDGGLIEFLGELTGLPFQRGLVGTIPFTPVPGYQFLHHPEVSYADACNMLLDYIDFRCETQNLSTARIYFLNQAAPVLHSLLSQRGYIRLSSDYCAWFNHAYTSFDDYLGSFKSSRRTKIKREIRTIRESGIEVEMLPGTTAPGEYFNEMYQLYEQTWEKHMGPALRPFLNATFFRLLGQVFSHRSSFSVARRGNQNIALAIFYHKAGSLYGRYWGCHQEVPFLHFVTCYYHPIEFAIKNGFDMMDPGFGGEHKTIRGYEPVPVYHYIKFYGEQQRRIAGLILKQVGVPFGKPYRRT
ncbi:GNAT family N-acetyltransferase [Desulfoferrobacter suflitae]|uniref:GNAT family N-acetyltransferase n=1 Tax=Desulfoferrobacter suflitae TaxID=2865782 RepID=UPI002164E742|nr:GNAT family N-acetyltransferase [Desulfoferrobacter suflitae]MCK8601952.1 GNAT family N-acetyltransferase [Desulfoferrobacter suflitae]